MSDERGPPPWLWKAVESDRLPPRLQETGRFVLTLVAEFQRRDVGFLAAAVTYYAFLSLVPLALLSVAVASVLGGGVLAAAVRNAIGNMLTEQGQTVIETVLTTEAGRSGATLVSLAVLVWGGLRVFRGLDRAFSQVYGSMAGGILDQVRDGVVVLVSVGMGFVGMGLSGSVVSLLPLPSTLRSVSVVVVWVMLAVAFLPLYMVLPDADVSAREALPGATIAAMAFTVLGTLFGVYATFASRFALYGFLGAVLLLLAWLNLVSTAIIGGAVVNAVLAGDIGEFRRPRNGDGGPAPKS